MRVALAGEALPLWVSAERQTAGRGRAGRSWTSEPGNLQASVALTSEAPLAQAGELALVAGVALFDAIRNAASVAKTLRMRLKWPNDVLIGAAKAGGILVETTTARGAPGFLAIIGFGVNVGSYPSDLVPAATSLVAEGAVMTPDDLLDALASRLDDWLTVWDDGRGFAGKIAPAWTERAGPIGEAIAVSTASGRLTGRYAGIDERGYLALDADDGTRHTVTHGDVALTDQALGAAGESGAQ